MATAGEQEREAVRGRDERKNSQKMERSIESKQNKQEEKIGKKRNQADRAAGGR